MDKKNVSVILCHQSDTLRPDVPSRTASANELILIDKKDGSFVVQSIDAFGEPLDISKEARLQVLTSPPGLADEPLGMTFSLKPSENAIVTVTVTWGAGQRIGPLVFQVRTHVVDDGVVTVLPVDPVPGDAFIDADIRSTSPAGNLPKESAIRTRANEVRAKKKAELDKKVADAKAAKAAPKPGHTVMPPAHAHPAAVAPAHPPAPPIPIHTPPPVVPFHPHPIPPATPIPAHVPTPIPPPEPPHQPITSPPISEE